jgi:hypothetical protein
MTQSKSARDLDFYQLRDFFRPVHQDQRERVATTIKPVVIFLGSRPRSWPKDISKEDPKQASYLELGDSPSITLFVARKGTNKLSTVRNAVLEGDGPRVIRELATAVKGQASASTADSIQQIIDEPVYAEFRYAEYRLADHVFAPADLGISAYVFPVVGARLSPNGFSLIQWQKPGSDAELEAVVFHNAPPRTMAEDEAAAGLLVTTKIGPEKWCESTWIAVAAVASFTAGAAAAAGPSPEAFDIADLGDDVLRRFNDDPTVDDLISLRKSVAPSIRPR